MLESSIKNALSNYASYAQNDMVLARIESGRIDRYTAWNLYNAIQGTVQHDSKNTLTKNRSVLMGEIAKFSNESMTTVLEVCSSEHLPKSIHDEIDALIGC